MNNYIRPAHNAGHMYDSDPQNLLKQIRNNLTQFHTDDRKQTKFLIAPHDGYNDCGDVISSVFAKVDPTNIKRIFVLGPNHYEYQPFCGLSEASIYETPLGNVEIDQEVVRDLLRSNETFRLLKHHSDETEHCVEILCLNILALMKNRPFKLIPLLVGDLDEAMRMKAASCLLPYFNDPSTLWCISSNFCHWGDKWEFTKFDPLYPTINDFIRVLDEEGVKVLSKLNYGEFDEYLNITGNTICGKESINVILRILCQSSFNNKLKCETTLYHQSNTIKNIEDDESISYLGYYAYI